MSGAFPAVSAMVLAAGYTSHDEGVRQAAALSGRLAYLFMCLTLCWGVLTATGWIRRVTGHQALRGGHMLLGAFTVATAGTHALSLLFLDEQIVVGTQVLVPFLNGTVRHALGIIAFDLMVAIAVTAGMQRFFRYRNWLRFHQTAYAAIALGVAHSWWGAWTAADLELVWLGGITAIAPAITLTVARFAPASLLVKIGLVDDVSAPQKRIDKAKPLRISVDNQRCHRYGFCQTEAPNVFQLREDGRLAYRQSPDVAGNLDVLSAARSCPMRAIHLEGTNHE
ncbi:ferric reductase-like transmembrane domain-containing protein [Amycolatopsis sp. NPDC059027]|uniref:ferric reductase-like transmembrane domain-containing protein n=1 Tax=unclassified Amycolatopsis TaxID=2618356 RepID=UPI00366F116F